MTYRSYTLFVFCTAFSILPSIAFANAGTPLLWLTMIHLAFGNLAIGVFEGLLLSWILKTRKIRSMLIMIIGNYVSAAIGSGTLWLVAESEGNAFQSNYFLYLHGIVACLVFFLFCVTVVVESVFCFWAQSSGVRNLKRAFWASLAIQTVSYVCILPFYFLASRVTFGPSFSRSVPGEVNDLKGYILFLNSSKREILRINFDDLRNPASLQKLKNNGGVHSSIFLTVKDEKQVSIGHSYYTNDGGVSKETVEILEETIDLDAVAPVWKDSFGARVKRFNALPENEYWKRRNIERCGNQVVEYATSTGNWKVDHVGTWAVEGIGLSRLGRPDEKVNVAVEIPPFYWRVSCVTRVSKDRFVFSFGPNIVLMDIPGKSIHWLASGHDPIVVLEN